MVHAYAISPHTRERVTLVLFGSSILLAYASHLLLSWADVSIPWWVESPSALLIYGVLRYAFDHWGWHLGIVRQLTHIPNLSGRWIGNIRSSHFEHQDGPSGELRICQDWTTMSVRFLGAASENGDRSTSSSEMAVMTDCDAAHCGLAYAYLNEPDSGSMDTMHIHRGTARLKLDTHEGRQVLTGEYYTGRDRQTHGRMHFVKQTP